MAEQRLNQSGTESELLIEDNDFDDDMYDHLHHPQQRNAANARERARMRVLSKAFCRLKTTLPWVPPDTKLSKLDTLRLATSYIAHLRAVLKLSENDVPDPSVQPVNLSWPFNFQVNWETQTTKTSNEHSPTKQDWNTCSTYHNKKLFSDKESRNYDRDEFSCDGTRSASHQYQNNAKMIRKNNLHCYEINRSEAYDPVELFESSHYKSCRVFYNQY